MDHQKPPTVGVDDPCAIALDFCDNRCCANIQIMQTGGKKLVVSEVLQGLAQLQSQIIADCASGRIRAPWLREEPSKQPKSDKPKTGQYFGIELPQGGNDGVQK